MSSEIGSVVDEEPPGYKDKTSKVKEEEEEEETEIELRERSDDELEIYNLYGRMMHATKEITLMLLLCIAYTALTQDPPKISKPPSAFPFFPEHSFIKDYYRGDVSKAIDETVEADVVFVMFYAPWDAESQELRPVFEEVARFLKNSVSFAAVNCWHPGGECRNKYSKVYNWPVLIAYTTNGRVIQYNGPKSVPHLIKFLENIKNPYIRMNSNSGIYNIFAKHDALILARVQTKPITTDFAAVYTAALKFLEKDPLREIAFHVISKAPHESTYLRLHMWNETLIYPEDEKFNSDSILNWISKHVHQLTMWVVPTGSKSLQLSSYLTRSPTLFLFAPNNPLYESNDYYNMLKEIALEYYNCEGNLKMEMLSLFTGLQRRLYRENQSKLSSFCAKYLNRFPDENLIKEEYNNLNRPVVTYSSSFWRNNTCANCRTEAISSCPIRTERSEKCGTERKFKTSMLNGINSADKLRERFEENRCRKFYFAGWYLPETYSRLEDKTKNENENEFRNITGLSCKNNSTLTLIAMDSLLYHQFAERFGLNVLQHVNKTGLLLINEKEETHYVYEGVLTDRNFKQFLVNFTERNLKRASYSSEAKTKFTHVYPLRKDLIKSEIVLDEFNSKNFLKSVMRENTVVIVLYYSKQCAYCSGISHAFLTLAKKLRSIENIKFGRIDGDLNTLPWEYTMENYPSILFFPARRKSESRVFPRELPITVPNLLGFVLTNLDSITKLNVMWLICNDIVHEVDQLSCASRLRKENLSIIETTLRRWRLASPRDKQKIARQLRKLKNLHLHFDVRSLRRRHTPREEL